MTPRTGLTLTAQLNVRIGVEEARQLGELVSRTGETRSELVSRLIREEHARTLPTDPTPETPTGEGVR